MQKYMKNPHTVPFNRIDVGISHLTYLIHQTSSIIHHPLRTKTYRSPFRAQASRAIPELNLAIPIKVDIINYMIQGVVPPY